MPDSPEQDHWLLEQENLVWGPALRQLLWIVALRDLDYWDLWGLYQSIMDEETFKRRIYSKIRALKNELRAHKTNIVTFKQQDEYGVSHVTVVYYPADRYLHNQEVQTLHIKRDAASAPNFVKQVVDELLKQGVPKQDICDAFQDDEIYANLFSDYDPDAIEVSPLKCPLDVLAHVQEHVGREEYKVLECSIERLIEHAPSTIIRMKLLTFKRVYGIEPQRGRSLPAKVRWFQTWEIVLATASGEKLQKLQEINQLVEPLKPLPPADRAYLSDSSLSS